MARKKFAPKKYKHNGKHRKFHQKQSRHGRRHQSVISEDDLLGYIYSSDSGYSFIEIMNGLDLDRSFRKELNILLTNLCNRKLLTCKDTVYKAGQTVDLLEGTLSVHPRGFAFATVDNPPSDMQIDQDLFVPAAALATATHGDRVLLKVTGSRRGRFEARVIRVLKRAASSLVGIYMAGRSTSLVMPEDERYPFNIVIRREHSCGAKNGEAVVVEITNYKPEQRNPEGKIIEVLGNPDDLQVQTEITIRKFGLPHRFSGQVNQQVGKIDSKIGLADNRADLRNIFHVTIDGEDARDFDDAVGVIKTRNGYRLYVSIADVSHYVSPGTPLDQEAYQRGTSVYFPTRVVPMLPERLSNDLCSLVPDKDRLSFTAMLDFNRHGKREKKEFTQSIIRSRHRLTYTIVREILVDKNQERRKQYNSIIPPLEWMAELAGQLEQQRMARGSIGFEIPEAKVVLGEENKIAGIARQERNLAHKIIEEFMLAANEAVAETFAEQKADALYRIHETPDPVKVEEFSQFAQSMGIKIPPDIGSPAWFGKVLTLVSDTPQEYIVNNLLLRTMKQACYSPENVGHFGLAASHYTHFTSPIRRYPDLMVHRVLSKILAGKQTKKAGKAAQSIPTTEAGIFLSKRERVAIDAEREMVDRLKVRFMADKTGEVFDGVIAGVTSFGIFVELLDQFISGAVAITDLKDDYYGLDEKHHRLIGRSTGKTYQIGNVVRVRLKSVEIQRRRINFVIETENHG